MLGAIIGDIVGKHCKTRQIIETNFSSLLKKGKHSLKYTL